MDITEWILVWLSCASQAGDGMHGDVKRAWIVSDATLNKHLLLSSPLASSQLRFSQHMFMLQSIHHAQLWWIHPSCKTSLLVSA